MGKFSGSFRADGHELPAQESHGELDYGRASRRGRAEAARILPAAEARPVAFGLPPQPTRMMRMWRGPWAPRMFIASMSAVPLVPVMMLMLRGIAIPASRIASQRSSM